MSAIANSLPGLIAFPEDRQLIGLSNWAIFCDHMKSVARATGLTGYLDGTIPAPSPPASTPTSTITPAATSINSRSPSVDEWKLRDGRLAGIIYQNVRDPRSVGITEDMSAHTMWERLTSEYSNSSAAAQSLAKERIQKLRYDDSTPFEEYFKKLEALRKAASDNHGSRSYSDLKRTLVEYDMMVESASSSNSTSVAPNALAVPSRSNSSVKNCWAKGGGSEGKAPRWYNAPKGMEPSAKSVTAASIQEEEENFAAAATIYDFSDYDFGDWESKKTLPF
ncbi:hypothetical protein FB446DRAFT_829149 [Lentinula raphanica]|nr:hypothetical protein FB446DRAFT_829149 [Lentinula raphanica]